MILFGCVNVGPPIGQTCSFAHNSLPGNRNPSLFPMRRREVGSTQVAEWTNGGKEERTKVRAAYPEQADSARHIERLITPSPAGLQGEQRSNSYSLSRRSARRTGEAPATPSPVGLQDRTGEGRGEGRAGHRTSNIEPSTFNLQPSTDLDRLPRVADSGRLYRGASIRHRTSNIQYRFRDCWLAT